jgi:hypothetical protein
MPSPAAALPKTESPDVPHLAHRVWFIDAVHRRIIELAASATQYILTRVDRRSGREAYRQIAGGLIYIPRLWELSNKVCRR